MKRHLGAAAALVLLMLSGCGAGDTDPGGGGGPEGGVETTAPATPADRLRAAADRLDDEAATYRLGEGEPDDAKGAYDPTTRGHRLEGGDPGRRFAFLIFGNDVYASGEGQFDGKHMHLDGSRVNPGHALLPILDPYAARQFLLATTTAEESGAGAYSGTFDLSKVSSEAPAAHKIANWIAGNVSIPPSKISYTATLDDQGRLTEFKTTFPEADDGKDLVYLLHVDGYGGQVSIVKPGADQVIEAPEDRYRP